jgi:hypothetical protein
MYPTKLKAISIITHIPVNELPVWIWQNDLGRVYSPPVAKKGGVAPAAAPRDIGYLPRWVIYAKELPSWLLANPGTVILYNISVNDSDITIQYFCDRQ